MKSLSVMMSLVLLMSASILLSGCNTVQGAFQGAGEDTKALVNELHLNNPPAKHKYYSKRSVTKTNVSRSTSGGVPATTTTTTSTTTVTQ